MERPNLKKGKIKIKGGKLFPLAFGLFGPHLEKFTKVRDKVIRKETTRPV